MPKGYMYILECADGSYYTGSTKDLERRLQQHQSGEGANHTKKHLPVKLVYFDEFDRIDHAFYREKQVQGWSRKKKEALINGDFESLSPLSVAYRDKDKVVPSRTSVTNKIPIIDNSVVESQKVVEALKTTVSEKSIKGIENKEKKKINSSKKKK